MFSIDWLELTKDCVSGRFRMLYLIHKTLPQSNAYETVKFVEKCTFHTHVK